MNRCDKKLAYLTGRILKTHTKEHEQKELLALGERIPFIKAAYRIGADWSENTTYEEGKRHHNISVDDTYYITANLYLSVGDKLSDAIKFVAGHDERRNFKLNEKNDPENLPEHQTYYEIIWTETGVWSWRKALRIHIHFDTKAECKMVPTGDSIPVMKMVCNGNSAQAAEMLKETELVD